MSERGNQALFHRTGKLSFNGIRALRFLLLSDRSVSNRLNLNCSHMKKISWWLLVVGAVFIALGLVSCTSNRPYRRLLTVHPGDSTYRDPRMPAIPTNAFTIETNGDFKIGYVEFDDQGWFWAHRQWQDVKEAIGDEETNSRPNGLTIVVFVHGWKNNADVNNTNVQMFRGVLANLSATLYPRKVFGVYVGWRGMSTSSDMVPPAGMELSFYNRKSVAERIGYQGAATQVFTELDAMQEDFNAENKTNQSRPTELIIIGHSFGGELVYTAISQVLIERLVTASRDKPLKSFGNLVVLVNPAFEASLYDNLASLATAPEIHYATNQTPVLAIFTSTGDWATGLAFPAGRRLSELFEKTRPSKGVDETNMFNVGKRETANQHAAILETVGHDDDYLNYDLLYTNYGTNLPALPGPPAPQNLPDKIASQQTTLAANNRRSDIHQIKPYVFPNSYTNADGSTNYYACILQARVNTNNYSYKPRNPFLNVAVDKTIIHDHNDINNPIFLKFLREFILFTQTNYVNESDQYLSRREASHE
jgi:hypothetical protein